MLLSVDVMFSITFSIDLLNAYPLFHSCQVNISVNSGIGIIIDGLLFECPMTKTVDATELLAQKL